MGTEMPLERRDAHVDLLETEEIVSEPTIAGVPACPVMHGLLELFAEMESEIGSVGGTVVTNLQIIEDIPNPENTETLQTKVLIGGGNRGDAGRRLGSGIPRSRTEHGGYHE